MVNFPKGSNGEFSIREFDRQEYNGPSTDDFYRRVDSIALALQAYIDELNLSTSHLSEFLRTELSEVKKYLRTYCHVDPQRIIDGDSKYYKEIIDHALTLMQKFIIRSLQKIHAMDEDVNFDKALKKIERLESEVVARKGRPNLLHTFRTFDQEKRFASARCIGKTTNPSTLRTQPYLSNFLQYSFGTVTENGSFREEFSGYRHSSYPPIGIYGKDDLTKCKRRAMALIAAKQMLAELARKKIAEGADPNATLCVNLASMLLLTPFTGDKKFMGAESETQQVKESCMALQSLNGREVELEIDGIMVTVKPSLTQMNMPSNGMGKIYKLSSMKKFNLSINNKGSFEFIDNFTEFLHSD